MDTEGASEELVEVEVVPQTVNEIIYLQEEDLQSFEDQPSLFMPVVKFEENDDEEVNFVPVDNDVLPFLTVTLQESQPNDECEVCMDFGDIAEDIVLAKSAVKCGINLYECKLCNKRFRNWNFISSHMVTHGKEWRKNLSKKKLSCTQCRAIFDDPRSLTYHFKWEHDVPKSFICDICSCSFVSENGLTGHYKKHLHPKEFVCHICSAGYDNLVDIENHYKTHRTNLLYACNKCDAGFAGTVELSAHLRHVHPRKPVPKDEPVQQRIYCPIPGATDIRPLAIKEEIIRDVKIETVSENKLIECEDAKVRRKRGRPRKKVVKKTQK